MSIKNYTSSVNKWKKAEKESLKVKNMGEAMEYFSDSLLGACGYCDEFLFNCGICPLFPKICENIENYSTLFWKIKKSNTLTLFRKRITKMRIEVEKHKEEFYEYK